MNVNCSICLQFQSGWFFFPHQFFVPCIDIFFFVGKCLCRDGMCFDHIIATFTVSMCVFPYMSCLSPVSNSAYNDVENHSPVHFDLFFFSEQLLVVV